MRNSILVLLLIGGLAMSSYGQEANIKAQTYAIKKSSDYIYGEASGEDENICYEIAKEKLMERIKLFMDTQPDLVSADAILIENIQSKVKKLTYERSIQIKVVCVYVHKHDIAPLYKKEIVKELKKANTLVQSSDSAKQKESLLPTVANSILMPESSPSTDNIRQIVTDEETSIVVKLQSFVSTNMKEKSVEEPSIDISVPIDWNACSLREKELLSTIMKRKKFNEILSYLEEEKNTKYDIRFKLVRSADAEDCYWLIFNQAQELVAIFDKSQRNNLLNANSIGWNSYNDYPKMWLYIYK